MGRRGPAPTPTAKLKARGSWRANEREGEVAFEAGRPTCPTFLGAQAKAEWKRQVEQLERAGVLAQVDRAMLAAYCEAWGEFVELSAATTKAVAKESYAAAIAAGLVGAKNKAAERMARLAQQFGFSPASRSRVKGGEAAGGQGEGEKPKLYKIRS